MGWKQAKESTDEKLVGQILLWSWHGVTFVDGKWHYKEGVTSLYFTLKRLLGHVYKELWSLMHLTEANFQGNTIKGVGFEVFGKTRLPPQSIILCSVRKGLPIWRSSTLLQFRWGESVSAPTPLRGNSPMNWPSPIKSRSCKSYTIQELLDISPLSLEICLTYNIFNFTTPPLGESGHYKLTTLVCSNI